VLIASIVDVECNGDSYSIGKSAVVR
jgi:hypothetical protein